MNMSTVKFDYNDRSMNTKNDSDRRDVLISISE